MRFLLDDEQREFGATLDRMLASADTPAAIRSWATGEPGPGLALWSRVAQAGVFALAVPEEHGGTGLLPVELAVAFVELGRHAAPGPLVETVAAAALLDRLDDKAAATAWLPGIAQGDVRLSLMLSQIPTPYALVAYSAEAVLVVAGDELRCATACGPVQPSIDPARRLARPLGGEVLAAGPAVAAAADHAAQVAALLTAAQALGVGRRLLSETVAYAGQRTQFGAPIGSFQAVKHQLADVLIGLEFAQPLVYAAALALSGSAASSAREIAAAKVSACEAAYAAARTALQLHGAIGYTDELPLSLWIRKARALRTAWGTPASCRALILAEGCSLAEG